MLLSKWVHRGLLAFLLTFSAAGSSPVLARDLDAAIDLMKRQDFAGAVPLLKRLAEGGNVEAQAYYGGLLLAGAGIQRDVIAARHWLEKAGPHDGQASFNRGMMSELGDGVPADPAEAVRWYMMSAGQGFSSAMVKVGGAYRDGWGVLRDPAEAARWLRSSAQAGEVDGQNLLGVMIAMGEATGTRRDAYVWFLLAERGGHPDATKNLGVLRPLLSPEEMADGDRRAAEWRPVPPR